MEKPLYESKTIWAGGLIIFLALLQTFYAGGLDLNTITEMLIGVGFVGARQAIG